MHLKHGFGLEGKKERREEGRKGGKEGRTKDPIRKLNLILPLTDFKIKSYRWVLRYDFYFNKQSELILLSCPQLFREKYFYFF